MKRLRDWSVSAKIWSVLALIVVLMGAQAGLAYRYVQAEDADEAAVELRIGRVEALRSVQRQMVQFTLSLHEFLDDPNAKAGALAESDLSALETALEGQAQIAAAEVAEPGANETLAEHMEPFAPLRDWLRTVASPAMTRSREVAAGHAPRSSLKRWSERFEDTHAVVSVISPIDAYVQEHYEKAHLT